jgi:hypothetical protein
MDLNFQPTVQRTRDGVAERLVVHREGVEVALLLEVASLLEVAEVEVDPSL